jgi:subtilisin family serine protease
MTTKNLWIAGLLALTPFTYAQKAPENWFNLDPTKDKVAGVSTERVYQELLRGRTSQPVIVAVIDGGTDPEHEDLKDVIWTNKKEIPNNGIDDDKNGYVDDIHGWNFLGGKDGKSVNQETLEVTRLYVALKDKYANVDESKLSAADKAEYALFKKYKEEVLKEGQEAKQNYTQYKMIYDGVKATIDALKDQPLTKENVAKLSATGNRNIAIGKQIVPNILAQMNLEGKTDAEAKATVVGEIKDAVDYFDGRANYNYNPNWNVRDAIVGDDPNNLTEKGYGNNDVKGPSALHGTHVAGIIGAVRNNGKGINGVADNVQIMVVRVVPDGDERDKDVANGIRYAVDNGAKVINMSFGKGYSPNKATVDAALQYAASKDVVLVHAAGNDNADIDVTNNFPSSRSGEVISAVANPHPVMVSTMIEVGALNWKMDESLAAPFSNYGQKYVDVFAPGMEIYSTTPDNTYKNEQGTSMAAPVVAGVAALLRSYFPNLNAVQVKSLIMRSAVKQNTQVVKPGEEDKKVAFSTLSNTGGIVSAYEAVKAALQMPPARRGGTVSPNPIPRSEKPTTGGTRRRRN